MGNLVSACLSNFRDNFIIMLTVDILCHPDLDFKACVNNLMLVGGHVCIMHLLHGRSAYLAPSRSYTQYRFNPHYTVIGNSHFSEKEQLYRKA